jgi:transcriptional regulator with XRE-family HTH domain
MERFRKADGAALRRRREDAWLTQQELAELAQVHRTTINTIENGKDTSPRMSTLLALARALKVHPDALVEGSQAVAHAVARAVAHAQRKKVITDMGRRPTTLLR